MRALLPKICWAILCLWKIQDCHIGVRANTECIPTALLTTIDKLFLDWSEHQSSNLIFYKYVFKLNDVSRYIFHGIFSRFCRHNDCHFRRFVGSSLIHVSSPDKHAQWNSNLDSLFHIAFQLQKLVKLVSFVMEGCSIFMQRQFLFIGRIITSGTVPISHQVRAQSWWDAAKHCFWEDCSPHGLFLLSFLPTRPLEEYWPLTDSIIFGLS